MSLSIEKETLDLFQQSLERCTADSTFLQRFYARFMLASDEVAQLFENVDLKRQVRILRASLCFIFRAAMGHGDGKEHLEQIARSHSSNGYDIKPAFYEHWLEALLAVAEEVDPAFDKETRAAWERTLRPCINMMIAHSEQNRS